MHRDTWEEGEKEDKQEEEKEEPPAASRPVLSTLLLFAHEAGNEV